MKVLIIPMSAMAETAGSFQRASILANKLKENGIDVALCSAKDTNFREIEEIKNYYLSIPVPLGLPKIIGTHTFPIAQKLGITSKKAVNSFEDVLHLTGNINYKYLKKSISEIQKAIQDYKPDVIYSEFNIGAIIAGKLEDKKVFISASIPTQYEYSSTPKYSAGLNKLLKELNLPIVNSCLELFSWADKKFVPSCYELEPFNDENVIFCGTWKDVEYTSIKKKNKILVYMGNGTISQKKMVREIMRAFQDSSYEVYIAGKSLKVYDMNNIHIAERFDFTKLLPEAALFINHGGQNSVIDGLIYGVPQIVCPGMVFERKYNAQSIVKNGAGIELSHKDFIAEIISHKAQVIFDNNEYKCNAQKLGNKLIKLGGVKNITDTLMLRRFKYKL